MRIGGWYGIYTGVLRGRDSNVGSGDSLVEVGNMKVAAGRVVKACLFQPSVIGGCYTVLLVGKNKRGRKAHLLFTMPEESTKALDEYMEMLDSDNEDDSEDNCPMHFPRPARQNPGAVKVHLR